ncbi:phosphoethanolamine transferase [Polaromonas eurypsychrophila]|uniref:Phosphoethanolamine--lipid A transferase EptA n=1 Tax=Polaromonas eurypsychrophila TaxID=1614635 RepID=A0A916S5P9_9BURK|nr:phosphoethanolamine--lipid A transferase [Polaromonas eurypsychrophila]GGA85491.1 phosphoethanolamine--lipid A transferase EptA [Polaromonas eurypsychrophila]
MKMPTFRRHPVKAEAAPTPGASRRTFTHPGWLILAVSSWLASAANLPLWLAMRDQGLFRQAGSWLFALEFALMITACLTGIASVLAWRWTLKPMLALLLLSAAFGAHFMLAYHVVIDTSMISNALQSDVREVRDLLGLKLAVSLLLLGVLPFIALWHWPVDYGRWPRRGLHNLLQAGAALLALVLLVLASFSPLASNMRNHKDLRYLVNPLNAVYALGYLASQPLRRSNTALQPMGLDARAALVPVGRPPLLVLVLGETGRSGNFGLNGYGRDTTPELARQGVSSFRQARSCGTSTAASVPCMFSGLGREGFDARKHNTEGLLDVIQHAGLAVLWLDNQSGCKGACDRVPNFSTTGLAHPQLCPSGECFDGIMLEGLDQRIAALPAERRARGVVVVLHQMGSHGPAYHLRSPVAFKRFGPECTDNDLQGCGSAALINAYDNSIAYTDHFLSSTITWLQRQQAEYAAAMVYVADHGESLGENNLYLHGMPYMIAPDVQKHVPWITWISAGFAQRTAVNTACLRERADRPVSHDNYFHSVLGLLGIQTRMYQRALDVYAPCAISRADEMAGKSLPAATTRIAGLVPGDI